MSLKPSLQDPEINVLKHFLFKVLHLCLSQATQVIYCGHFKTSPLNAVVSNHARLWTECSLPS